MEKYEVSVVFNVEADNDPTARDLVQYELAARQGSASDSVLLDFVVQDQSVTLVSSGEPYVDAVALLYKVMDVCHADGIEFDEAVDSARQSWTPDG